MKQGKKIYIRTNGCYRRQLDVFKLIEYFRLNKCVIIDDLNQADYIFFVTCSFKKSKEEECFKYIEEFSKYRGELIVLGCLPGMSPIKLDQKFKGRFIPTKNLNEIDKFFNDFKIKFSDIKDANFRFNYSQSSPSALRKIFFNNFKSLKKFKFTRLKATSAINAIKPRSEKKEMSEAYLRISCGCLGNCSYCSIPKAIGKLRSKPLDICLEEYKKLLKKGYRNFSILADDVGAYGLDIDSSFADLMTAFSDLDKGFNVNWFIQELHPKWAVKYKIELLKWIKERKINHLQCAIQSGSLRILKLMNRYCDIKNIAETLLEFRKTNPDLCLSTHIIIGFPSEAEKDFHETLDLIKKIKFNYVQFFPYYDGYGAPSSKINNKVDEKTIRERLKFAIDNLEKEGIFCICDDVIKK